MDGSAGAAWMTSGGQILILEDSVLLAMAVEGALRDCGFSTLVAGSLRAAERIIAELEREQAGDPSPLLRAALLDLSLPDGDAADLALRLHHQGCRVALVSGVDREAVPQSLAMLPVFMKPVPTETLTAWVSDEPVG